MSKFFNENLIKALFTRNYICPRCGGKMEFEDESCYTLICTACNEDVALENYGADPYENLYPTYEEQFGDEDDEKDEDE